MFVDGGGFWEGLCSMQKGSSMKMNVWCGNTIYKIYANIIIYVLYMFSMQYECGWVVDWVEESWFN